MRITKNQLRQIIKEELGRVLREQDRFGAPDERDIQPVTGMSPEEWRELNPGQSLSRMAPAKQVPGTDMPQYDVVDYETTPERYPYSVKQHGTDEYWHGKGFSFGADLPRGEVDVVESPANKRAREMYPNAPQDWLSQNMRAAQYLAGVDVDYENTAEEAIYANKGKVPVYGSAGVNESKRRRKARRK